VSRFYRERVAGHLLDEVSLDLGRAGTDPVDRIEASIVKALSRIQEKR